MLRKNQRGRIHFEQRQRWPDRSVILGPQTCPFVNRRGAFLVIDEYLLLASRRPPGIAVSPAFHALRLDDPQVGPEPPPAG